MTSALLRHPWTLPPVIELRQYALRPGRREALVALFERELLDPQEHVGMRVLGQFRDLDRPDHFVWLRGFSDMAARAEALAAFYDGPAWAEHRDAANATMLDSDDVLLLRPVLGELEMPDRPPSSTRAGSAVLTATIHLLREPADAELLRWYATEVEPLLEQAGSPRLALLETEPAANTFPRLPVRDDEFAVVRLSRFPAAAGPAAVRRRVEQSPGWAAVSSRLDEILRATPLTLRLQPTPRSSLR